MRRLPLVLALILSAPLYGQIKSLTCTPASITGAGTAQCTVTTIPAGGSGWPGNGIATVSLESNNSAITVPPNHWESNGTTSFTFTATAIAVTVKTAVTLTAFFNSAGATAPQTFVITLNPSGTPPPPTISFTASPTSLPFGNVAPGAANVMPLTLTATGAAVNYAVTLNGSGYYLAGAFEGTIASGGSTTLEVLFSPSAAGSDSGTLTVTSNSSSSPTIAIPLSGTGATTVAHSATLSWSPPTSTAEPIASYEAVRSDGQTFDTTELSYVDTTVVAGQTYTYYVQSVGSNGQLSVPSNSVTATIP